MSGLSIRHETRFAALLVIILALPSVRHMLEALPSVHMLVQMPLLVLAGIGLGAGLSRRPGQGEWAVPTLFLAVFTVLFWMVPRSFEATLSDPVFEAAKFISVPLMIGLPLRLCWRHLTLVCRAFLMAQFVAMLAFLGWLYAASPIRVCNSYLAADQQLLGWHLLLLAAGLAMQFGLRALLGASADGSRPCSPLRSMHNVS